MRSTRFIHVVRSHAEGEVGDIIVDGVAPPPGDPAIAALTCRKLSTSANPGSV